MRKILFSLNVLPKVCAPRRNITSTMAMNIQTFVFLDSETTGLPHLEHNKTKMTELCLTVVQSDHISMGVHPRVQNKISFCFNPCKMIGLTASELTGLSNHLLEYQSTFKAETVSTINHFLSLQRKPICFVAHNGNYFDYPIFKAEVHKTGNSLPDDVLCIDSLQAFRKLFKRHPLGENAQIRNTQIPPISESPQKPIPIELCDGFDDLICQSVEDLENSKADSIQAINETTPTKSTAAVPRNNSTNIDMLYYPPSKSETGDFGSQGVRKGANVRNQLKWGNKSFKLVDVYEYLTNKAAGNCHRAEEDVNMLIECAATLGQDFVDWANTNAKLFKDVPMMQAGRKLGT